MEDRGPDPSPITPARGGNARGELWVVGEFSVIIASRRAGLYHRGCHRTLWIADGLAGKPDLVSAARGVSRRMGAADHRGNFVRG